MFHLKHLRTDEKGAVGTIFAIIFGAGVLFGILALTVDVGRIYAERRVVQNAADAAIFSAARACAIGECDTVTVQSLTTSMANPNSPDDRTDITSICKHFPGSSACAPLTDKVLDCKSVPMQYAKYVRVYARGYSNLDGELLIPVIANAVTGGSSGLSVTACAQAAWGTASSAKVYYPFALPPCRYGERVDTNYKELPSVNSGETRWENCFVTDHDGVVTPFTNSPTGYVQVTLPGLMDCSNAEVIHIGQVLAINTANDSHLCGTVGTAVTYLSKFLGTPQYIPIVSDGTSNDVTVQFFVKFKLIAFWFGNKGYPDVAPYNTVAWWNSRVPSCNQHAGKDCLYGQFERAVITDTDIDPDAPALGLQTIHLLP